MSSCCSASTPKEKKWGVKDCRERKCPELRRDPKYAESQERCMVFNTMPGTLPCCIKDPEIKPEVILRQAGGSLLQDWEKAVTLPNPGPRNCPSGCPYKISEQGEVFGKTKAGRYEKKQGTIWKCAYSGGVLGQGDAARCFCHVLGNPEQEKQIELLKQLIQERDTSRPGHTRLCSSIACPDGVDRNHHGTVECPIIRLRFDEMQERECPLWRIPSKLLPEPVAQDPAVSEKPTTPDTIVVPSPAEVTQKEKKPSRKPSQKEKSEKTAKKNGDKILEHKPDGKYLYTIRISHRKDIPGEYRLECMKHKGQPHGVLHMGATGEEVNETIPNYLTHWAGMDCPAPDPCNKPDGNLQYEDETGLFPAYLFFNNDGTAKKIAPKKKPATPKKRAKKEKIEAPVPPVRKGKHRKDLNASAGFVCHVISSGRTLGKSYPYGKCPECGQALELMVNPLKCQCLTCSTCNFWKNPTSAVCRYDMKKKAVPEAVPQVVIRQSALQDFAPAPPCTTPCEPIVCDDCPCTDDGISAPLMRQDPDHGPQPVSKECLECEGFEECTRHDPYAGCLDAVKAIEKAVQEKDAKENPDICTGCQITDCTVFDSLSPECLLFHPETRGKKKAETLKSGGPTPGTCGTCGHHKGRKTFHPSCPRLGELLFKGGTKSAKVLMEETQRDRCEHWITPAEWAAGNEPAAETCTGCPWRGYPCKKDVPAFGCRNESAREFGKMCRDPVDKESCEKCAAWPMCPRAHFCLVAGDKACDYCENRDPFRKGSCREEAVAAFHRKFPKGKSVFSPRPEEHCDTCGFSQDGKPLKETCPHYGEVKGEHAAAFRLKWKKKKPEADTLSEEDTVRLMTTLHSCDHWNAKGKTPAITSAKDPKRCDIPTKTTPKCRWHAICDRVGKPSDSCWQDMAREFAAACKWEPEISRCRECDAFGFCPKIHHPPEEKEKIPNISWCSTERNCKSLSWEDGICTTTGKKIKDMTYCPTQHLVGKSKKPKATAKDPSCQACKVFDDCKTKNKPRPGCAQEVGQKPTCGGKRPAIRNCPDDCPDRSIEKEGGYPQGRCRQTGKKLREMAACPNDPPKPAKKPKKPPYGIKIMYAPKDSAIFKEMGRKYTLDITGPSCGSSGSHKTREDVLKFALDTLQFWNKSKPAKIVKSSVHFDDRTGEFDETDFFDAMDGTLKPLPKPKKTTKKKKEEPES